MNEGDSGTVQTGKILILGLRDLKDEEWIELTRKTEGRNVDFQLQSAKLQYGVKGNKVKVVDIEQIYRQSYDDAFSAILEFGELELENCIKLADQLKHRDGFSWWYYFRFMALYKYRQAINDHRIGNEILALQQAYTEIHVYHSSGRLDKLIGANTHSHQIKAQQKSASFSNLIRFLFIFKVRTLIGVTQLGKLFWRKKHFLLTNAQPNQTIIRKSDLAEIKGDHFSEYLQDDIEERKEFLNITELFPPNMKSAEKIPVKKETLVSRHKNTLNLEVVLWLQLFNPWFYVRSIRGIAAVHRSFKGLHLVTSDPEVRIIGEILPSFKRLCYFLSIRKAALKWLFVVKNPTSVGGTNEHDPRVKSILETAKSCGVTTFGIQHGVIHPRHMHYCFTVPDANRQPFPDVTFLWGDHWKAYLLADSSYQESNLRVVGQIRSDIINQLNAVPKNELVKSLSAGKVTVMYPSQPLYAGEGEMRKRLASDFLKLTKAFPEIQFVIKPHPKEIDCMEFMGNIASSIGTTNYQVLSKDLYKMIAASDLVVVYNSTVGAEAIYFNKPLLVMDYSGNDFSGFIAAGVGREILNYDQLHDAVKDLAKGKLRVDHEAQQTFIRGRGFQVDGLVTQRIIKELNSL